MSLPKVQLRVDVDGREYKIAEATFVPVVRLAPDMARGVAAARVDVVTPLAQLLRDMADQLTRGC